MKTRTLRWVSEEGSTVHVDGRGVKPGETIEVTPGAARQHLARRTGAGYFEDADQPGEGVKPARSRRKGADHEPAQA